MDNFKELLIGTCIILSAGSAITSMIIVKVLWKDYKELLVEHLKYIKKEDESDDKI